ncbi:MAG: hypothetical protein ACXVAX_04010 [Pseudobdellovibrio sp.]
MSQVLLYSRPHSIHPASEKTINILSEQLQHIGINVDIAHTLNIPRLILNSYQTVHLVIDQLPLTANEAFHFAVCKALGKSTLISILNSDRNLKKAFLNFVKPDALSVSQTNHFKHYRNISCNKFVFPALPKTENAGKKTAFNGDSFLIPLHEKLDEVFQFTLDKTIYFDGRSLVTKQNSGQIRKKWNELVAQKKINENYHLILSENKLKELLDEESLAVVLCDVQLSHTQFTDWLNITLNKKNLIVLNDYKATSFSSFWTSGQNCIVLPAQNWVKHFNYLELNTGLTCTHFKPNELYQPLINELSRLYSKLYQQKTTLLTSRSVKL